MEEVSYHSISGVNGKFFRCKTLSATLSDKSCSALYLKAMSFNSNSFMFVKCQFCPIGAKHSGNPSPPEKISIFYRSYVCSRCFQRSTRMIRNSICVSCYNREREFMVGKNARGSAPIRYRKIGSAVIWYLNDKGLCVRKFDRVSSRVEAVISILHNDGGAKSFGWSPSPIVRAV